MRKRKLFSAIPLLLMVGNLFSVDGSEGGGGGQSTAPKDGSDTEVKIAKAINVERAKFQAELKEATGHESIEALRAQQLQEQGKLQELANANAAKAEQYRDKLQHTQINNALLSAATDAIDVDVIVSLLAGKASVDDSGVVSIDGKSAKEAVDDLLKAKPHLAKSSGVVGSGAPHSSSQTVVLDTSKMSPAQKLEFGLKTGK